MKSVVLKILHVYIRVLSVKEIKPKENQIVDENQGRPEGKPLLMSSISINHL